MKKESKKSNECRYYLIKTAQQEILFFGTEKAARDIEHECRIPVKRANRSYV